MALVQLDAGARQIIKSYFKKVQPSGGNNLTLKLFCNNLTPVDTNVAGDFTEASGGGYSPITLLAANWTDSEVGGISQAAYAQQTFGFTGALTTNPTIYGAYIVDADGVAIFAERAPGGVFTPANNGDTYKVTPVWQLSNGTPT
jgi:hypothetical protein